ncbi:glycosyltransferase family 2 protein [Patescibacteria group bacterium]
MDKITTIILLYKPEESVLKRNLEVLEGERVILVNNDPEDKGFESYGKKENITYIANDKNLGFAGGVNIGLEKAMGEGAIWMIVTNQDMEITKNGFDEFKKTLQESKPGVVGPFAGKFDPKRWTTIIDEENIEESSIDYVSGSCMAIHKDVIEKIGYLYEPYFMYYEDAEYCTRARRSGFGVRKVQVPGIVHQSKPVLRKGSASHLYYLARNHMLFVRRNAPLKVVLYEIARMPKTLMEHFKNGENGAIQGVKDFAINKFGEFK